MYGIALRLPNDASQDIMVDSVITLLCEIDKTYKTHNN